MCLCYTKPETIRRDGSNEVTWACSESLLALLFTHHRFLLNRSIAAGRARARPIRKFALLDRVDFVVVGKVLGGQPAQDFVCLLLSQPRSESAHGPLRTTCSRPRQLRAPAAELPRPGTLCSVRVRSEFQSGCLSSELSRASFLERSRNERATSATR